MNPWIEFIQLGLALILGWLGWVALSLAQTERAALRRLPPRRQVAKRQVAASED